MNSFVFLVEWTQHTFIRRNNQSKTMGIGPSPIFIYGFNNSTKKISNGYRPKNVTKACPLCPKKSCHVIISINKLSLPANKIGLMMTHIKKNLQSPNRRIQFHGSPPSLKAKKKKEKEKKRDFEFAFFELCLMLWLNAER